jgi:glycosyltransferase involved in cell wall biosynthesis
MKILLLIRHFDFGGAENHVCELANELVLSGHEVWLLSGKGRQRKRLLPGVISYPVNFSGLQPLSLLFQIVRLIRNEGITVIHAHQRFTIFLATVAGRITKTPVIATVHGSTFHDLRTGFVRRNITKLIVISENSYTIQLQRPDLCKKLFLIPNGFIIPANHLLINRQYPAFQFYYVSRLDNRHASLLVKIITKVWPQLLGKYPGTTLHIVGDGKGFKKITEVLSAPSNKKWSFSIFCESYAEDVSKHYQKADLVLGVGRVVGESLSHGVPALSIKYNHLGPIVTCENFEDICYSNFVAINAPPPNPEGLLQNLEDFLARPAYYKQEAVYLQKVIAQRFNIRDIVQKTEELYRDACCDEVMR